MRTTILISILAASIAGADRASEYVNFIRQVQGDTGVEWDVNVASEGTGHSLEGIPEEGSKFELWTVHQSKFTEYLLDEEYVTAYFAKAAITITTGDPYEPVPRTRVDQPFQVRIDTEGLLAGGTPPAEAIPTVDLASSTKPVTLIVGDAGTTLTAQPIFGTGSISLTDGDLSSPTSLTTTAYSPEEQAKLDYYTTATTNPIIADDGWWIMQADGSLYNPDPDHTTANNIGEAVNPVDSSKLLLVHCTYHYPEDGYSLKGSDLDHARCTVGESTIDENGTTFLSFARTHLHAPDLTAMAGEEVFTVTAMAGVKRNATVLDSARVQIWPIAQATISGYDPATKYEDIPPISIMLKDLYPASTTYLRIYAGPPVGNPSEAVKVRNSIVIIKDAVPHNRGMLLNRLDEYLVKSGLYTMEVIHETPFGADLLVQATIQVDNTIEVKGSLFGLGQPDSSPQAASYDLTPDQFRAEGNGE